jgi:hypothetical protein
VSGAPVAAEPRRCAAAAARREREAGEQSCDGDDGGVAKLEAFAHALPCRARARRLKLFPCYARRRVLASHVALTLHALLAQAPAQQVTPAPEPAAIDRDAAVVVWFRSADAATIDGRALMDAVTVYTRDLGLTVRGAPDPAPVPTDATSARDAAGALRAQGARLGFWCELRPDANVAVLTVVGGDGHLELHLVERTGAHEAELYRAIGLKLRSVLTGTAIPEPLPPRAAAAPAAVAPPATAAVPAIAAQPASAAGTRVLVSVGYQLSTPVASASARHALALGGALALGRLLEISAGTELAPRLEEDANGDHISLRDWPIVAGARVVRHGPRASFGGGAFAALHLLWASATGSAGDQQSSFTAAGGAGVEALARLRLSDLLAGELRVYAEVPLPTTRYKLDGVDAVELATRAGIGAGLVFPGP